MFCWICQAHSLPSVYKSQRADKGNWSWRTRSCQSYLQTSSFHSLIVARCARARWRKNANRLFLKPGSVSESTETTGQDACMRTTVPEIFKQVQDRDLFHRKSTGETESWIQTITQESHMFTVSEIAGIWLVHTDRARSTSSREDDTVFTRAERTEDIRTHISTKESGQVFHVWIPSLYWSHPLAAEGGATWNQWCWLATYRHLC